LNSPYARAVQRYWWIATLGVLAALALAVFMVDHVALGFPPKLTPRTAPVYAASAQLFVDGPNSPYLRTKVTDTASQGSNAAVSVRTAVTALSSVPDTAVLLNAANLYPVIIQSDQVTALREQTFGSVEGSVVAQAAFASATPYGAYRLSPIPIINVKAYAAQSKDALKLTEDTVAAFHLWLTDKQAKSKIPDNQRVIVRQLQAPESTTKIDSSSFTAPAGIAILVMGLTFGLIVLVDRRRGNRGETAEAESAERVSSHAPTSSPTPSTAP
jgi:hypothetical protein